MNTPHQNEHQFHLFGKIINIGPGTVPISMGSVSTTSIQEVAEKMREVSRLGIFDTDQPEQTNVNGAQ